MTEIVKEVLKTIGTIAITLFLPKHIQIFIKEVLKFGFQAILKYWHINLLILLLVLLLFKLFNLHLFLDFSFAALSFFLLSFIISFLFFLKRTLRICFDNDVIVFGCFSAKDREYLQIDLDAEIVNKELQSFCSRYNSRMEIFKSGLSSLVFLDTPKFIPIILGYRGLNSFILNNIKKNNCLFAIYFLREIDKQRVVTFLEFEKEKYLNPEFIDKSKALLNYLADKSELSQLKIVELSLKIALLVFNEAPLGFLLAEKKFERAYTILSDSEGIIDSISEDFRMSFQGEDEILSNFLLNSRAATLRFKAILLIEQEQYIGAVQSIFRSIKLNPYYPYDNYESFKRYFIMQYGISFSYTLESYKGDNENSRRVSYEGVRSRLAQQIELYNSTFNTDIIIKIVSATNDDSVLKLIEFELSELSNNNPALLLLKSDVVKYLPKGKEMYNKIYAERFDDCIEPLRAILNIDSEFPLIYTKIGALLTSKGVYMNSASLIEEGLLNYEKGRHLYAELGLISNET